MVGYPQSSWQRHQGPALAHSLAMTRLLPGTNLLDDFKTHLRVSGTAEDGALVRFLDAAARALEDDTRRLLLTGAVTEYYDVWPFDYVDVLHLTRAPVVAVTSIKYYDTDDVLQTWASTNYTTDLLNEPARILLAELATLTSPNVDQRPNAVEVAYTCGYGSAVTDLAPETINAIFVKAAHLYARGRELGTVADSEAVERCWQNEIRRLTWSMY